jgi:hypothetical protein
MGEVPWDKMFQYGFSVLAFLILFFAPSIIQDEQNPNLESVELITPENRSYADAENLTVTVSGSTTVTKAEDAKLFINSTEYIPEEGLLEVGLAENRTGQTNLSTSGFETVNYSIRARFSKALPQQVIVSGVMGEPEAFTP